MEDAVKDLVLRMTGGNAAVAGICSSTVAGVEEGSVCRRVDEEEAKLFTRAGATPGAFTTKGTCTTES